MPLLTRRFADKPPFRVFEVPAGESSGADAPAPATAGTSRGRRVTDAVAS